MLAKKSGAVAEVEGPADPCAVPTVEQLMLLGNDEHAARNIAGQEQGRCNRGEFPYRPKTVSESAQTPATSTQQENPSRRSSRF
jgi:hypothetical protein